MSYNETTGVTDSGATGCSLIVISIYLALAIGWCLNIYKFVKCDFEPSYKAEIIRGVGIATGPVGGVIGWLNIDDNKVEK